jgi:hypothetical protein
MNSTKYRTELDSTLLDSTDPDGLSPADRREKINEQTDRQTRWKRKQNEREKE